MSGRGICFLLTVGAGDPWVRVADQKVTREVKCQLFIVKLLADSRQRS